MSDERPLNRELFEVHMNYQNQSIEKMNSTIEKIFSILQEHEKTLARNTTTVELHRQRSDILEYNQEKFTDTLDKIATAVKSMQGDVADIEKDLLPIKEHVADANKVLGLFTSIYKNRGLLAKILVALVTFVSALWYGISEALQKGWFS